MVQPRDVRELDVGTMIALPPTSRKGVAKNPGIRENLPFAEAEAWHAVGQGWRQLFGSFGDLGFSFEWHDFLLEETLDWSRSFHPDSLEICLKAMIILRKGIDAYIEEERAFQHHRLVELASFLPDLSGKDKAILRALTHFTYWAGRYPDPGSGRVREAEEIFSLSETHQITGRDLFGLATRVMQYTSEVLAQTGITQ